MRKSHIFVTLCIFILGCSSSIKSISSDQVSLCQVSKDPRTYNNKVIKFHANIISDGIEGSYIADPACANFVLGLAPSGAGVGWGPINTIIYQIGQPGTYDKTISATFTGLFHKGRIKGGLISISNIENVSYQKK